MLRNYLTIALRNLRRNKIYSAINIGGLAVGMAICLLIVQYVSFELSYDDFHANKNRIHRIVLSVYKDGKLQAAVPKNFTAAGPALKADFPEVQEFTRIFPIDGSIAIKRDERVFNEKHIYFADPSFFQLFSFPMAQGNANTALSEPNAVVITAAMAKKYFGEENPLEQQLVMREGTMTIPLTVKGIVADIPENTHLTFDFLISHATLTTAWGAERADKDWGSAVFYTYVLLAPDATIQTLQEKFSAFIKKYINWGPTVKLVFETQPLPDIYLHSDLVQEAKANGNWRQVYFLLLIAGIVMLMAWINFVNLSTARSIERAKEVGVRKVIGASRFQLLKQFTIESVLVNLLAMGMAFVLVQVVHPYFVHLTGKAVSFEAGLDWVAAILLFFAGGAIASAVYPGLVLSSFKPIRVLRGRMQSSVIGNQIRKGFTVVQFTASIVLITGTFTVYSQLRYMMRKDMGMDINQTLVVESPDVVDSTFASRMRFFRNELSKHPEIRYVTSSTSIPGKTDNIIKGGLQRKEQEDKSGVSHYGFQVDYDFIDAYSIRLLAGRNFSNQFGTDNQATIINRTALSVLGFAKPEDAIGKQIVTNWTDAKTIIGVVDDFHQQSLKAAFDPVVFVLDNSGEWGYYSVKIDLASSNKTLPEVISTIKTAWTQAFPGNPFDYFFMDEYFNAQYQTDQRFANLFGVFASLSILIACLGLLGVVSFTTIQRTKEIGVRKVLGASVVNVLTLLNKGFLKLILLANLIAWPIAYWGVTKWLQNYAFSIEISPWLFVLPSLLTMLIVILTVSAQTWQAARTNPVKSLRSE